MTSNVTAISECVGKAGHGSRDRSLGIARDWVTEELNSRQGQNIISSPFRPDRFLIQSSLLSSGYRGNLVTLMAERPGS
jgi:hypothetical protein